MGHRRAAGDEAEEVAAFAGGEAGVEVIRDTGAACRHGDGQGPQVVVQRLCQAERVPVAGEVDMGDLTCGMDAGVGAASGGDGMGAGFEAGKGRLDGGLHRGLTFGLTLPALERGTVILDLQGETRHVGSFAMPSVGAMAAFVKRDRFPRGWQRCRGGNAVTLDAAGPLRKSALPMAAVACLSSPQQAKGLGLGVSDVADGLVRGLDQLTGGVMGPLYEPVVRLGVTGLSRAGKTVFITGLVANLLQHGRMPQLKAAASGRLDAVYLQPQPDLTLPRFAYEDHLAAMTGDTPQLATFDAGRVRVAAVVSGAACGVLCRADRATRRPCRYRRLSGGVVAGPWPARTRALPNGLRRRWTGLPSGRRRRDSWRWCGPRMAR